MAYTYEYINRLEQFGSTDFDLVISDEENILPEIRIHKSFSLASLERNPSLMEDEANREIALALSPEIE